MASRVVANQSLHLMAGLAGGETNDAREAMPVSAHLKTRKSGQEPTAAGSGFSRSRGLSLATRAAR